MNLMTLMILIGPVGGCDVVVVAAAVESGGGGCEIKIKLKLQI